MNLPHVVKRLNAEATRFRSDGGTIAEGIDETGRLGDDSDSEVAADARDRQRRTPRIPGVRVLRNGSSLTYGPPRGTPGWKRKGEIHPRRRNYPVHSAKGPGKPSYADSPELVAKLLGRRRIRVLRVALAQKGQTTEERDARAYLAVVLGHIESTPANIAAAELLIGWDKDDADARGRALRQIRDLRNRKYEAAALDRARRDFRAALYRLKQQRKRQPS